MMIQVVMNEYTKDIELELPTKSQRMAQKRIL